MTTIDDYLHQLQRLLHVRGRMRRRLLTECRDHLQDASAHYGPEDAVRRFGTAEDIAAALNTEVAARQAQHATVATVLGVLAVAGSTLALLHSSDPGAGAPAGWAIAFFAAAQTAAVCVALAALQAAALRRRHTSAPDVALLCRRNACALVAAGVTLFAAGGAVPGHGSAVLLLSGPVLAAMAGLSVLGTRSIIRGLPAARQPLVRSPLTDLSTLTGLTFPHVQPAGLLPPTVVLASVAAFLWDHDDQGTLATALTTAGTQAFLVVLGFLILGPALGLRARLHLN